MALASAHPLDAEGDCTTPVTLRLGSLAAVSPRPRARCWPLSVRLPPSASTSCTVLRPRVPQPPSFEALALVQRRGQAPRTCPLVAWPRRIPLAASCRSTAALYSKSLADPFPVAKVQLSLSAVAAAPPAVLVLSVVALHEARGRATSSALVLGGCWLPRPQIYPVPLPRSPPRPSAPSAGRRRFRRDSSPGQLSSSPPLLARRGGLGG